MRKFVFMATNHFLSYMFSVFVSFGTNAIYRMNRLVSVVSDGRMKGKLFCSFFSEYKELRSFER